MRWLLALALGLTLWWSPARADSIFAPPIVYTAPTTWTPTDGSGAALAFTSVNANYTRVGNMIFAYATLTYPSTVSGSNAIISGFPVAFPNQTYAQQCSLTYSNIATAVHMLPVVNSTSIGIFTTAGAAVTNTTMATGSIFFICTYPAI